MSPDASVSLWLDGRALGDREVEALAPVGYGHFTAMQVRRGAVRGLAEHLRRVDAAHHELFDHGLDLPPARARWAAAARERPDSYLRATYYDTPDGRTHELIVIRVPVAPSSVPQRFQTVRHVRPFAHLKHVGTFAQIAYGRQAERNGYDDAVLVTDDGEIAETTIANIGFLRGSVVVWPTAPALHGIGQQLLESALPAAGIAVEHQPVRLDDVTRFDGAFAVNSIGVVSVAQIDTHRFSSPKEHAASIVAIHDALAWTALESAPHLDPDRRA